MEHGGADDGRTGPVVLPGALAINPITWTRTQTEATAAQNLGSIRLDPRRADR